MQERSCSAAPRVKWVFHVDSSAPPKVRSSPQFPTSRAHWNWSEGSQPTAVSWVSSDAIRLEERPQTFVVRRPSDAARRALRTCRQGGEIGIGRRPARRLNARRLHLG